VRSLGPDDVVAVRGLPVTGGAQTLLDLAATLAPDELVAVGDALFRAGHLDHDRLDARLHRATGARGVVLARRIASMLTPLAASRPESLFRYWLLDSDLPDPEPQVPVLDRWGRPVAHADLGYRRWKVALEYEGRHHAERTQFGRVPTADLSSSTRRDAPRRPTTTQQSAPAAEDARSGMATRLPSSAHRGAQCAGLVGPGAPGSPTSGGSSGFASIPASVRCASVIGVGAPVNGS
jgi:hypothetical protein